MRSTNIRSMLLLSVVVVMALVAVSGCAKKVKAPPETAMEPTLRSEDRAVIVHRSDEGARHYYRDDKGKLYYIDQTGAVNVIERNPRVERGPAGLYYIIDDDNVNYSTDDSGRLYYRDSAGRMVYIEDSGAGKVIDPLPILRGDTYPKVEYLRSMDTCNDKWRSCLTKCNEYSGINGRRNCLDNCDAQREQCVRPY
jgi:hypothetical protein